MALALSKHRSIVDNPLPAGPEPQTFPQPGILPRMTTEIEPPTTTPSAAPASRAELPAPDARYLAHDARNWLTVLQVYCDLLAGSDGPPEDYQRWIGELASAVERGQALVLSLLDSMQRPAPAAVAPNSAVADPAAASAAESTPLATSKPPRFRAPGRSRAAASQNPAPIRDRRWTPGAVAPAGPLAQPLELATAIRRRLPLFERLAGAHIHVEHDLLAGAGSVTIAESAFERILQNLVGNAIDAMPRGGRLRIVLKSRTRGGERGGQGGAPPAAARTERRGLFADRRAGNSRTGDRRAGHRAPAAPVKTLLLRIYDTGDGIRPEHMATIFEPGVTSKSDLPGSHGEHGFGLAIVRELAESAGGTVRVRSRLGEGSCFEVELPRL